MPRIMVPVVMCRECKNWDTDWEPTNRDGHWCGQIDGFPEGDFYCTYGERKEAENG